MDLSYSQSNFIFDAVQSTEIPDSFLNGELPSLRESKQFNPSQYYVPVPVTQPQQHSQQFVPQQIQHQLFIQQQYLPQQPQIIEPQQYIQLPPCQPIIENTCVPSITYQQVKDEINEKEINGFDLTIKQGKINFAKNESINAFQQASPSIRTFFKTLNKLCGLTCVYSSFFKCNYILQNTEAHLIKVITDSMFPFENFENFYNFVSSGESSQFVSVAARDYLWGLMTTLCKQDQQLLFHLFTSENDFLIALKDGYQTNQQASSLMSSVDVSLLDTIIDSNQVYISQTQTEIQLHPSLQLVAIQMEDINGDNNGLVPSLPSPSLSYTTSPSLSFTTSPSTYTTSPQLYASPSQQPSESSSCYSPSLSSESSAPSSPQQQHHQEQHEELAVPNEVFSDYLPSEIKPRASLKQPQQQSTNQNGKAKVTKSEFPKGIVTPKYLKTLTTKFGFTRESLEQRSNINGENYITGKNRKLTLVNTRLSPISSEVSTGRDSKNGIMLIFKDHENYPNFNVERLLVTADGQADSIINPSKFRFKKNNLTTVEPGILSLQFSVNRLEKTEKKVAIRFNVYCGSELIDTVETPFINFRNTPSEFEQPSNIVLNRHIMTNIVCDGDNVACQFIAIANQFKKGIVPKPINSSSSSFSASSSEDESRPVANNGKKKTGKGSPNKNGKPLEIQLKNRSTGITYTVPQHISKVQPDDKWRFPEALIAKENYEMIDKKALKDTTGDIIHFSYSYVLEFSCILERGTYDVVFKYDSVKKNTYPVYNFIV